VVGEGACGDLAEYFEPPGAIEGMPVVVAVLAACGAAVGFEVVQVRGAVAQRTVAVRQAALQRPVRAQFVAHEELLAGGLDQGLAIARFAEEARIRDQAQLAVHRQHAAVERRALLRRLDLVGDRGGAADQPQEGRRQQHAFAVHVIAEAAAFLVGCAQAVGQVLAQGAGEVGATAPHAMAADAESGHVARREARLLGDDVHRPAGLAASVQGRGRPLQDLDAVGVRAVAQAVVAAAGIEAVDQVVGTEVRIARETAHGVAVPQTGHPGCSGAQCRWPGRGRRPAW